MITQQSIEKVFDVAHVEDVVNEFVNLKRRGANLLGLCPFHDEKTPSFTVSPTKGLYKCFGCGKAGNSVGFIMEHEKLTYPEAIRFLANKYNIEIEEVKSNKSPEEISITNSLLIVANFAKEYFKENLWESEEGKSIGLSYFKERGYREETIKKFDLGFTNTKWDGLLTKAKENQFNLDYLVKIGLIRNKEERQYDFFRDRVMFTIHNISGKAIAFAGRTLQKDKKIPKYINSPESDIYIKNKILYGIFQAKSEIRKLDECFLVEGYTDVISMHQAGIENIVASSGTSLTENQVRLIKRYTKNITILYDGDAAGIKAALRGIEIILEQDMNVKVLLLPEGEDPDSFIQSKGKSAFESYANAHKKDFILFKIDLLNKETNQEDPVQKTAMIKEIVAVLAKISDPIKRQLYVQQASTLLNIKEEILVFETNKIKREEFRKNTKKDKFQAELITGPLERTAEPQGRKFSNRTELLEKEMVKVLLEYGDKDFDINLKVKDHLLLFLEEFEFEDKVYDKIFAYYKNANSTLNSEFFINHAELDISTAAANLLSEQYILSDKWEETYQILITEPIKNFKIHITDLIEKLTLNFYESKVKMLLDKVSQLQKGETDDKQMTKYLVMLNKINAKKEELALKRGTVIN